MVSALKFDYRNHWVVVVGWPMQERYLTQGHRRLGNRLDRVLVVRNTRLLGRQVEY